MDGERITISLRDGTELLAEYYIPKFIGREVVVLIRTALERRQYHGLATSLSGLGYGVIVQSVRGRDGSGGVFVPYRNEQRDGQDTLLQILADSRFKEKRLVLLGEGYDAQSALSLALFCKHSRFVGMVLADITDNQFVSGLCTNGVITRNALSQALYWHGDSHKIDISGYWRWVECCSPCRDNPVVENWLLAMRDSVDDGGIWRLPGCLIPSEQLCCLQGKSVLMLSSYSQMSCSGACRLASRMMGVSGLRVEFWLGDWNGKLLNLTPQGTGKWQMASGASPGPISLLLHWLEKGVSGELVANTEDEERKVNYLMQEFPSGCLTALPRCTSRWCSGGGFPPVGSLRALYLHFGALAQQPQTDERFNRSYYVSDGFSKVAQAADGVFNGAAVGSAVDGQWTAARCVFYSAPLTGNLTLLGQMRLHIWCSFSRRDAIISASLSAEPPPRQGRPNSGVLLSYGVVRAGYRYGMGQLVDATPDGRPLELVMPLSPVAWTLPPGWRLRLDVGDCESPLWLPPPNPDARSPAEAGLPVRTSVCIWHNAECRSRLVF